MSFPAAAAAGETRIVPERSVERSLVRPASVAWAGVCALILLAPFEATRPLIALPWQSVSTVETALIVVFAAWLASAFWSRSTVQWLTPLTWPWIAFLGAMLLAALTGVDRINGLHMAGRFALAFGVYLLTVNGITTLARLRGVVIAAAIAGAIVALLVLLEYLNVGPIMRALTAFRPGISVLGSQVRAGGPFQYPTIASMYLEMLFALTLGLLLLTIDADRRQPSRGLRLGVGALFAIALLISEAVTLTFTRSGLITIATSLAIVAALRVWLSRLDRGTKVLFALAAVVAFQVLTSRSFELLRLRMTTEGQEAWYRVSIDAPTELTIGTNAIASVPVTLTNTGRSSWDSDAIVPFRFSYHWLMADGEQVFRWEGVRTDFPFEVVPGQRVSLSARVEAPDRPGVYRLMWDVEQVQRLWFSTEPDAELFTSLVAVDGPPAARLAPVPSMTLPRRAVRPGRVDLWRAASRIAIAHPLLGVGPDNYRLIYGGFAGIANFDQRTHANNMYLEILVGGGLAGALAFAWLCWRIAGRFTHPVLRPVDPRVATIAAAVLAAGAAIAIHGLVDSFLGFTGTYTLMAIVVGLAVAGDALNERDAHRV